jgi:hypothetical protein
MQIEFNKYYSINNQLEIDKLYQTVNKLKNKFIESNSFSEKIEFDIMQMGAYDEMLLQYCEKILIYKGKHKNTSWVKDYEDLVCIGRLDVNECLCQDAIIRRWGQIPPWDKFVSPQLILSKCSVTKQRWIVYKSREREPAPFSYSGNIKFYMKNLLRFIGISKKDRVLGIINSLDKNGFIHEKFYETDVPVLLKLVPNNCYVALTGRHRIAALRYLAKTQNKHYDFIKLPVIKIDSDNFALTETLI